MTAYNCLRNYVVYLSAQWWWRHNWERLQPGNTMMTYLSVMLEVVAATTTDEAGVTHVAFSTPLQGHYINCWMLGYSTSSAYKPDQSLPDTLNEWMQRARHMGLESSGARLHDLVFGSPMCYRRTRGALRCSECAGHCAFTLTLTLHNIGL